MGIKKLILAICGLGVLAMLFTSVNYYIERNKHNHPLSVSQMQSAAAGSEEKTAFNPGQAPQAQAPSIAPNAMLPENIPPAMLEAMKKQGLSIEDLQKAGMGGIQQNGGNAMGTAPKGMGSNTALPEEMLKALEAQNKQQSAQNPQDDAVSAAVAHIESHADQAQTQKIKNGLAEIFQNPGNTDTVIFLADTFIAHNETKAAGIILQKGIVAAPTNAVLPYLYGQALAQDMQFEKAAEQWERALTLQDSAEVRYSLGMLYRYKLMNTEKAKMHFQKASQLPAHDPALADHLKLELEK